MVSLKLITKKCKYIQGHSTKHYEVFKPDEDAHYVDEINIELSKIKPTVAFPSLPENTKTIDEIEDIPIDQVVIGSCTNGRIGDMRIAAKILAGKKVNDNVRCIIIPAKQKIWKKCMNEGLLIYSLYADVRCTPTCDHVLEGIC